MTHKSVVINFNITVILKEILTSEIEYSYVITLGMSELPKYIQDAPGNESFLFQRNSWRSNLGLDIDLRSKAISLIVDANKYQYGYQWEWCGVPIIRHPDDIVLQQEIVWNLKPSHIIETGIARGGSLVLSASLMEISGMRANVLGLDVQIFPHTHDALQNWVESKKIQIREVSSASAEAVEIVTEFLKNSSDPALLVLDSDHSHVHVLNELNTLGALLPKGSIVMVADTIISEMPDEAYADRPWTKNRNPLSAINEFLENNSNFKLDKEWSRRSLLGECRDGILRKIS